MASGMNFEHRYEDLTEIEDDPRYLRLCAMQAKALSAVTAKHAQERVMLALTIRRELAESNA